MTASRGSRLLTLPAILLAGAIVAGVAVLLATQIIPTRHRPGAVWPVLPPVSRLAAVELADPVTDAGGASWTPDPFSRGGSLVHADAQIRNTESAGLYRSERVGIASVAVPVRTGGAYLVVLYFAETRHMRPGQRVFDVIAQGRRVATVDVARDVGGDAPYHLAFTVAAPAHSISLRFVARVGRPILSALSVQPVASGLRVPAARLVWDDEFSGLAGQAPDPAYWTYDTGIGWHQLADYTDSPANVSLDGHGHLQLTARKDGGRITSVRMTTAGRFQMRYGVAAARLKVAGEPGFASTFWALGTNVDSVGYPAAGEIDPAEVRGLHPNVTVQALHMPCTRGECAVVWGPQLATSVAAAYHTFAALRAPGVVLFSIDGRQTGSLTRADVPRGSWVFDRPFYLLLNLIVGGWAGAPPPSTRWPVTMKVDWVRVFG